MVSAAQVHLAVNHLPVVGVLFASATLFWGLWRRRSDVRNVGLGLLTFAALSVLPAYLSGERAEEGVEHRPGVSESLIENHEEAAAFALATTLAAGLGALASLMAMRLRRERLVNVFLAVAVTGSLVATASLFRVAHLGGQIRHDEIRPQVGVREGAGIARTAS